MLRGGEDAKEEEKNGRKRERRKKVVAVQGGAAPKLSGEENRGKRERRKMHALGCTAHALVERSRRWAPELGKNLETEGWKDGERRG